MNGNDALYYEIHSGLMSFIQSLGAEASRQKIEAVVLDSRCPPTFASGEVA